jgi:hypothetical protein
MNLSHAFLGEIFVIFHRKYLPLFSLFSKKSLLKKYVMKALYAKADELVIIVCYPLMNQ